MGQNRYGNIDKNGLEKYLNNNIGEENIKVYEYSDDKIFVVKFVKSKRTYSVDYDGNVEIYNGAIITDIPNVSRDVARFSRLYGTIDVVFLSGTGYEITDIPNEPSLDNTMVPVYYDETTNSWIVCSTDDENWYNYEIQIGKTENTGTSRWANVMLTDEIVVEKDGISYDATTIKSFLESNSLNTIVGGTVTKEGSMLVWIPRYAYKITYYSDSSNTSVIGYSDSRGIVTKDGETPYDLSEPTVDMNVTGTLNGEEYEYYRTHPAFQTDLNQGGWNERITGIWVGKYNITGTTSAVTSINGKTIIKGRIGVIYDAIKNNFSAKTSESYMQKNSEYGAMIYLTESKYGRNGMNINAAEETSTGNVYGVYNICYYPYEHTAGYIADSSDTGSYGWQFASTNKTSNSLNDNNISTKYATAYKYDIENNTSKDNYFYNLNKIFGDAIFETSDFTNDSYSNIYSWDDNGDNEFARTGAPYIIRGIIYNTENSYGRFNFHNYNGTQYNYAYSSRVICIVK